MILISTRGETMAIKGSSATGKIVPKEIVFRRIG
jgi:hypothetical protein